ncbi:hypothetical protein K458DRAFT_398611 [Lentithecium fluviatile CBS 122367]|uniref:G domain-containing protein n=1 Tax=Lentithecium fluviatile CBS 122367 TaxID=1168545 RepID=A0A6G1JJ65_9PLEO|nr:hypothetical protein K458DRAFT_398611 [Lentithecium fluviatile CBS 122367]
MPTHQGPTMEADVGIAVMGLTGVGKSSFIKNVTRREDIQIGHGLTSETSEVHDYSFVHQGIRYTLVDTPGFNDTFESDETVTANILQWLESSYRAGAKLNGILYLHSIAAPKMAGSAFDNLCMFRKLCGEDALKHVVLATTFWGTMDPATEERRESALMQDRKLWGRMVSAGSKVVRLENTRESALDALRVVSGASKITLAAQHEMVDEVRGLLWE